MSRPHGIAVFADRFGADRALERHRFEMAVWSLQFIAARRAGEDAAGRPAAGQRLCLAMAVELLATGGEIKLPCRPRPSS